MPKVHLAQPAAAKPANTAGRASAGEVRQDFITGKWVVMAPGRQRKPSDFKETSAQKMPRAKYVEDCPLCNLAAFPQAPDVLRLPDDPDRWQVHIFPNKYPAFTARDEFRAWQVGPYRAVEAVGYHELLATRWHNQTDDIVTVSELALQLEALVLRYRQLREKMSVNYIQIIKNHGAAAGASLEHPHQQIFAVPILPSDVRDLLRGAEERAHILGGDPFAVMLDFEQRDGSRIVEANELFTAFCPFASRFAFEVWIVPTYREPYFENTDPAQRTQLAEILKKVLQRLSAGLKDPAFNYSIFSAPCDETGFVCTTDQFQNFRWHIQITPREGSLGGLEVGSGLPVVTILPEAAAAYLREQRLPL